MAKYGEKAKEKVGAAMHERKAGTLDAPGLVAQGEGQRFLSSERTSLAGCGSNYLSRSCPAFSSRLLTPPAIMPRTPGNSIRIVTAASSTLTTPEMV